MKRRIYTIATAALTAAMAFGTGGCGKGQKTNYTSVEPDYSAAADTSVMHIGAWVAPRPASSETETDYCTQEQYDLVAESGINTIYGLYEPWGIAKDGKTANERALQYAENAGIGFYIRDLSAGAALIEQDSDTFHSVFDKYLGYESFKGALVIDEPGTSKFGEIAQIKAGWDKFLPDKQCYVNLNPIVQTAAILGLKEGENYRENYIRRFLEDTKMNVLSFDNYPMLVDGWGQPSIQPSFLLNLEICAEEARRADVPLWVFIQAQSYDNSTRTPDTEDVRFQILCSMAYGVKGYQYFCYWTPSDDPNTTLAKSAMMTVDGKRTPIYYAAQTVNREVLAMDHVFLNYEWQGTYPVLAEGNAKNKCFSMLGSPLTSHERISNVKSSEDLLIGTFKDSFDNDAFMVVNFSDPALDKNCRAEINLKGTSKAVLYNKGVRTEVEAKNGKLVLEIQPGDGTFVVPLQ